MFTSGKLDNGYWPFRGLLFSIVVHASALFGALFPSIYGITAKPPDFKARAIIVDVDDLDVLFLPLLGASARAPADAKPRQEARPKAPAAASTPGREGLSYPGPQPI